MYAVICSGGKQYKVTEGQSIDVEKLNNEIGDKVNFEVLLFSDDKKVQTGKPLLFRIKIIWAVAKFQFCNSPFC